MATATAPRRPRLGADPAHDVALVARGTPWRVAACLVALTLFATNWWRYRSFRAMQYDLGVLQGAAAALARGQVPFLPNAGWNAMADHFTPLWVLLAPLERLATTPAWLFGLEALAAGAVVLVAPAFLDAIGMGGPRQAAGLVALLASPLLVNALLFSPHPTTMAVPLVLVVIVGARRGSWRMVAWASVCLLLLRDDLGVVVAAGACLAWWWHRSTSDRRWVLLMVGGLAWSGIVNLLASMAGVDRWWDQRYGYLGSSGFDAALHPWRSVPALVGQLSSSGPLLLLGVWVVGLAGLPLLSWRRFVLVVVLALPILGATDDLVHSPSFHYGAPFLPFLLLAAAGGIDRLERRNGPRPIVLASLMGCTLAALAVVGPMQAGALVPPPFDPADARAAVALVPAGAVVVADDLVAPHLVSRAAAVFTPIGALGSACTARWGGSPNPDVVILAPAARWTRPELLERAERCYEAYERIEMGSLLVFLRG